MEENETTFKAGNDVNERVAIITGADRGTGFEVSRKLGMLDLNKRRIAW